jgi:hypothetical protein
MQIVNPARRSILRLTDTRRRRGGIHARHSERAPAVAECQSCAQAASFKQEAPAHASGVTHAYRR